MEPAPEGATWVVRDAEGRVTQYGTEPIRLEMTTRLGEQLAEAGQVLAALAAEAEES